MHVRKRFNFLSLRKLLLKNSLLTIIYKTEVFISISNFHSQKQIFTVPVRKKGITSVLLSSFANKDNNKIERLTFDSNRNAKLKANNEFYIGKVFLFLASLFL